MIDRAQLPPLMLVTDRRRTRGRDLVQCIAAAVAGGVGIVQLREKDLPDDELRQLVLRLREAVGESALIVVNGRERVALTQHTGLHLPAAAPAPKMMPTNRPASHASLPFGRSAHDEVEADRAAREGVDYMILGHIYASASKPGLAGRGLSLLQNVSQSVAPIPVYAIGGVSVSRIPELVHAGARGVAVCGAILGSNHPRRVAQAMSLALEVAMGGSRGKTGKG